MQKKSSTTNNAIRLKLIVTGLIIAGAFFRFYQLDGRMQFTWDQIQNAWVMKDIIDDGSLPLLGMTAKLNTGFSIGPAYYYMLAPFYLLTSLDPIGAGVFVGVISIITLASLYLSTRNIFSTAAAVTSLAFYAFSRYAIIFDRIPWPVAFIPLLSVGVFYYLTRLLRGDEYAFLGLAFIIGFSFHIHFTAIFFVLFVLFCFPFVRWSRNMMRLAVLSFPFFLIWFLPHVISFLQTNNASGPNLIKYIQTYYHGFHLTRVVQLLQDGLIEYESLLYFREFKFLKFIFLPLFSYFYIRRNGWEKGKYMIYLAWIWFLVPLFVMSVYSGEISNYYFATTRMVAIITISYVIVALFQNKNKIIQYSVIFFGVLFIGKNIEQFFKYPSKGGLNNVRLQVKDAVSQGVVIPFAEGDPKSYFYYLYGERPKRKK